jgi:hypothetical protein
VDAPQYPKKYTSSSSKKMASANVCGANDWSCTLEQAAASNPMMKELIIILLVLVASFGGSYFGSRSGQQKSPHQVKNEDGRNTTASSTQVVTASLPLQSTVSTVNNGSNSANNNNSLNRNTTSTVDESENASLPAAFVCCITSELFVDPVIASDGHSYENAGNLILIH